MASDSGFVAVRTLVNFGHFSEQYICTNNPAFREVTRSTITREFASVTKQKRGFHEDFEVMRFPEVKPIRCDDALE